MSKDSKAGRHSGCGPHVSQANRRVLEDLGDVGARRGTPPRPLRRRNLAHEAAGRADLPERRAGVSRYLVQVETTRARSALMVSIPALGVIVAQGGNGFAKAVGETWPGTRVQRCTFHAFSQVKRYTTKPSCGGLCRQWCESWADFLEDVTVVYGVLVALLDGVGGDAVHLPGPGAHRGGASAGDQQQDRGDELPAPGFHAHR